MKTITTKYHGPAPTRGSRISATDNDGNRVTIPYPHEINTQEGKHTAAALALCAKLGWRGQMVRGYLKNGQYVFVWLSNSDLLNVEA